jgi:hypothetical protein
MLCRGIVSYSNKLPCNKTEEAGQIALQRVRLRVSLLYHFVTKEHVKNKLEHLVLYQLPLASASGGEDFNLGLSQIKKKLFSEQL